MLVRDPQTIEPWVIETADDGSFVIAGSSGTGASATKSDANGRTIWNYSTKLRESGVHFLPSPEYNGVAPMADGSTYLCGMMPHPVGSSMSHALLTHVDAKGQLLSENLVAPSGQAGLAV